MYPVDDPDHARQQPLHSSCTQGGDKSVDAVDSGAGPVDTTRDGHPALVGDAPAETAPPPRGVDLARRALEEARAAARERGMAVGRGGASPGRSVSRTPRRRRRWSDPGPDDRDPQLLASAAARLVRARGWSGEVAAGAVLGRWNTLVGKDIAAHAQPESLNGGLLVVRAESTAWATQLRMMQRQLLATIAAGVGNGVVTRLSVSGPTAPSWKRGVRRVPGRGPRDTYG